MIREHLGVSAAQSTQATGLGQPEEDVQCLPGADKEGATNTLFYKTVPFLHMHPEKRLPHRGGRGAARIHWVRTSVEVAALSRVERLLLLPPARR